MRPKERFTLSDQQGRPIEVYPPVEAVDRAPLIVALHATCMEPAAICDWFGAAGREDGWLVCPSGNMSCNGEPDWNGSGETKATFLADAIDRVEAAIPTFVDERRGVLFGWSHGAFAARDILMASLKTPSVAGLSKRFRGLVLMAAKAAPDVATLRDVGITRVVFAAGDFDAARPTMVESAKMLEKLGVETRFVSLGKIGHVWPRDFEERMREPIMWAAGD